MRRSHHSTKFSMRILATVVAWWLFAVVATGARAAEAIPPPSPPHVDTAALVSTAADLDAFSFLIGDSLTKSVRRSPTPRRCGRLPR